VNRRRLREPAPGRYRPGGRLCWPPASPDWLAAGLDGPPSDGLPFPDGDSDGDGLSEGVSEGDGDGGSDGVSDGEAGGEYTGWLYVSLGVTLVEGEVVGAGLLGCPVSLGVVDTVGESTGAGLPPLPEPRIASATPTVIAAMATSTAITANTARRLLRSSRPSSYGSS